jgi:hypothetical protein
MAGSGYHCRDGDSGGAVYAGSQAWGIHYATLGNCTYSRIAYALQAHRLTDVVTF